MGCVRPTACPVRATRFDAMVTRPGCARRWAVRSPRCRAGRTLGGARPDLREEGTGITAISEVEHGHDSSVSVTAKTSGMPVTGQRRGPRRGGSRDVQPRRRVRWVRLHEGHPTPEHRLALGLWDRAPGRRDRAGFTIVEGFSGVGERSRENAVWIDGRPTALDARTRFEFDPGDVMKPWRITTADGTVRLRFDPVAAHNEYLDVKAVRSLFIQPIGHFTRRDRRGRGGRTSSTGCPVSPRTRTSSGSSGEMAGALGSEWLMVAAAGREPLARGRPGAGAAGRGCPRAALGFCP